MRDFLDIVKNIQEDREKQKFIATEKDLSTIKATNPLVANYYSEEIKAIITNNIVIKLYEKNLLDTEDIKIEYEQHTSICSPKQLKEIQTLLDNGANVNYIFTSDTNITDYTHLSLLSIALLCKDFALCDLLIKNGATKYQKFNLHGKEYYPLQYIEQNFSPLDKQKFLDLFKTNCIAPISQTQDKNAEKLFIMLQEEANSFGGCKKSTLEFIKNIDFNPNYFYQNQNLMEVVLKNKLDYRYALALLDKGFNPNLLTSEGQNTITLLSSPSNKDATKHNQEIIDAFLQKGLDVNQHDSTTGKTLVMYACDMHNLALFRSLVHNGARCDLVDFYGNDVWKYADNSKCYGSGICKSLEKRYAKETSFYTIIKTLSPVLDDKQKLFEYIKQNKPYAEFLIPRACTYINDYVYKKSKFFNLVNKLNALPFFYMGQCLEVYDEESDENILIDLEDLANREKEASTMFYFLINHPYANVDATQDLDISNANALGFSLQKVKSSSEYYEYVEALLKKGADPNRFSGGHFPLEIAILNNDKKSMQLLMEYGAKPLLRYATLKCENTTKQFYSNLVKGNIRKTSPSQTKTNEYVPNSNIDHQKQAQAKAKIDDLFNEISSKF